MLSYLSLQSRGFILLHSETSENAKKIIPCQLNVPYGKLENEKIDIFGTDLPADAPIFIYVHGGYWQELSRELSSYMVAPLHRNKFKVIVIGYTLSPKAELAEIVDEVRHAFAKCMEYAEENGSKYVLIGGHSAGAHLTACLFKDFFHTLPSRRLLRGVFFISGVFDLQPIVDTYVNSPLKLSINAARDLSPLCQSFKADSEATKFYVVVGQHESTAFIEQSKLFFEKLDKLGLDVCFKIIAEVDHFDIVEGLNDDDFQITRLIMNC